MPHSITYDKAFDIFYATSVEERNAVWEVGRDGSRRILVGADSEASQLLGDNEITSIHYSGNTGTLFVLCSSCGLVFEVRPLLAIRHQREATGQGLYASRGDYPKPTASLKSRSSLYPETLAAFGLVFMNSHAPCKQWPY